MANPDLADTLLSASSDMGVVHRRVVRVGALASWFATGLFLLIGWLAGNELLIVQSAGPAFTGLLATAQVYFRREDASVTLTGAALIVLVFYTVLGNQDTIVPAAVTIVIICGLAMLFVETRVIPVVGVVGLVLFVAPQLWGLSFAQGWVLGSVMSLTFVVTTVIFVSIRSAMRQLHLRFQMLFESSPTAVTEEDWSESVAYVRSEYTGRPDRLRPFLLAYPAVVKRAVAKARILKVNRAAVELFEAQGPEELLGPRSPEKVTDETIEVFVEALVTLYEERTVFEQEMLAETLRGRPVWLQARAVDTSPERPGSRIIIGLVDITHIKERNEAMARLVKAKDEFIARVSHELRTPLTAVVGLTSELTSMESLAPGEHKELLGLVAGQAAEMSYIVEDLLVAARAEMGTVAIDSAPVDLNRELETTIELLGVRLDGMPDQLPEVRADPGRVRQILRNLLTNAERYGGRRRRIVGGELHDRVWIEVRDDGDGVPADMTEVIFEPYTTAHDGVSGSVGLGLSVSRQLAQMMGGALHYRRDAGETVFRLELPTAARTGAVVASYTGSA